MRLKITYKTTKIPNAYRMMFVSLLKKSLSEYNEDLYRSLYIYKDDIKNKKSKDFTFSVFMDNFKKVGDEFITDNVTLNISSANKELILHLYNALLRLKEFSYSGYTLKRDSVKVVLEKEIKSDYAIFKTMSPITVKDINGLFLDIDNPTYIESLNHIVDTTLKNYRGYGLISPIEFIPIDMKKIVVKENIKGFRDKTSSDCIYINSYKGVFALKGANCDLNDIYGLGIGFRRNQGFGMIDLV